MWWIKPQRNLFKNLQLQMGKLLVSQLFYNLKWMSYV